jgi:hypothetical protein
MMDSRYAARCQAALLDAVSCSPQVDRAMTMGRQGLQRLAPSPVRLCNALQAKDLIQGTHICVVKALMANCSGQKRGLEVLKLPTGESLEIGTGSETHASREDLSACGIGMEARAQLHVSFVTMSKCGEMASYRE